MNTLTEIIQIRVDPELRAHIRAAAAREALNESTWVRSFLYRVLVGGDTAGMRAILTDTRVPYVTEDEATDCAAVREAG